ncbi:gpW family head-tail joining protein [Dokdonella sp.]|uniref:gpW family head-tail joining protein n=1 Tax=Dokdonella sp. TaxID=2291710 RepID=UPI0026250386|nr:gpW family head-tail joining protein [Dokdonella sp.]
MPQPAAQQRLDEALAARHALLVGKATVSLGFGERRLEYTRATLAQLDRYIAELRLEIAGTPPRARNRIIYAVPN